MNLKKIYKNDYVIREFNYKFQTGLYLFIGENGSGKSTTIKMLSGLISPSNTDYYIEDISKVFLCERVELLNAKPLTFLKRNAFLNGTKKDIISLLKMWEIPNKSINKLSKGNKQKCAILMCYLANVDLYLFDEPTDALDQDSILRFEKMIKELIEKNKIVIIATHEKEYFKNIKHEDIYFDNH